MKAIVLCAGYGTRLGGLTRGVPKPMLPIQGRPLLEYTLRHLASQGFTDIAINLHFLPEQITDYFGDGSSLDIRIHYSYEGALLGTAGALKRLESWVADAEQFAILYGDVLTDQALAPLWERQRGSEALATLLLHQRKGSNSLIRMDKTGRIVGFVERPTEEEREANPFPWVFSGIQVVSARILQLIPEGKPCDLPRDIYSKVIPEETLYGVPLSGYRCAIDSAGRYVEAEAAVSEGRCRLAEPRVAASKCSEGAVRQGNRRGNGQW